MDNKSLATYKHPLLLTTIVVSLFLVVGAAVTVAVQLFLSSLLLAVVSIYLLFSDSSLLSGADLKTPGLRPQLVVIALLISIGAIQLIPLPQALLALLRSTELSAFGSPALSLAPSATLNALVWISILSFWALLLQYTLGREHSKRLSLQLRRIVLALAYICVVLALLHEFFDLEKYFGLFQSRLPLERMHRAHWPFINPNHLSIVCVIGIALTLREMLFSPNGKSLTLSKLGLKRFILLVLGLLSLYSVIVLSMSKAGVVVGIISFLLVLAVYLYARFSVKGARLAVATLAGIAVATFLFWLLVGGDAIDRGTSRFGMGLVEDYASRAELVQLSWWGFLDSPVFGVGYGSWMEGVTRYANPELGKFRLDNAHNEYAQWLTEGGLMLALTLIGLLAWWLITFNRKLAEFTLEQNRNKALLGLVPLVLVAIHALVDFPLRVPGLAFIVVILWASHLRELEGLELE